MSDFEKLKEELLSKGNFYSSLTGKHVFKVSNKFEMKTVKNYHNLYVKCDVLLLADVFQKFRNRNLNNYGLRPSH